MNISNGWYQVRVELEAALDRLFNIEPESIIEFDSLLSIEEMNALGYTRNFPHLTCLMCSLDEAHLNHFATGKTTLSEAYQPAGTNMALLPATCYKVYLGLKGQELETCRIVGCIAKCFRHEDKPLDTYRAFNFTMKEFVCLGGSDDAKRHLEKGSEIISHLMNELGISFDYEIASDPFFDSSGSLATISKLLPTKREVVFGGHAVGSLNFHRNYFGEKFDIKLHDQPINTSCVAFGLERWMAMFRDEFQTPDRALKKLAAVASLTKLDE